MKITLDIDVAKPTIFPVLLMSHHGFMMAQRLLHGADCNENPERCGCNIAWMEKSLRQHMMDVYIEESISRAESLAPVSDLIHRGLDEETFSAYMQQFLNVDEPYTIQELATTIHLLN